MLVRTPRACHGDVLARLANTDLTQDPDAGDTRKLTQAGLPRVLVCGSRDRGDREMIARELTTRGPMLVVHGGARGADRLAGELAKALGLPVESHPADRERYGKNAGLRRNIAMLDTGPQLVIAFTTKPGGTPGTRHTITNARRRGIPVIIIEQ